MLVIGIIGAGAISTEHIKHYLANPSCRIKAIADINKAQAEKQAAEYGIEDVYENYKDLLNDESIDAVSIVTPTFTHKNIVIDALRAGKHVLCEKPPALNAEEARQYKEVAQQSGKCLMFAFVCRFLPQMQYLKNYIDAGKMGKILSAETMRLVRCSGTKGWMLSKSKSGGGPLIDVVIHEIDSLLYLMGYPKPKTVVGFTCDTNNELPEKTKNKTSTWVTADQKNYGSDVETFVSGYVTFENGSYLFVKSSSVLFTVQPDLRYIELHGENAGAKFEYLESGKELHMVDYDEYNCFRDFSPEVGENDPFQEEINHFVDCCMNGTDCICRVDEAVALMEIIDAIYKSAEHGEPVLF